MKKISGFSLAEALITLLIVAIIAVASAPIITKKARKNDDIQLWTLYKQGNGYIFPKNNRDIMLGSSKNQTGIIVNGTLVFKNSKGEVLGWISEDGTSSFAAACPQSSAVAPGINLSPAEIDRMVKLVTESISRQSPQIMPQQTAPASSPQKTLRQPVIPAQTQQISPDDLNKQLNEMGKSMNIDFGALLQGLQ